MYKYVGITDRALSIETPAMYVSFEVTTAVTMEKNRVVLQRFGGTCCTHLQCWEAVAEISLLQFRPECEVHFSETSTNFSQSALGHVQDRSNFRTI